MADPTDPTDPVDLAREVNRATLTRLVIDAGLDPDRDPPPSVAAFLPAFGAATALRAQVHQHDPDALRWISIVYAYWSEKLAEFALAAQMENAEVMAAEAERALRDGGSA